MTKNKQVKTTIPVVPHANIKLVDNKYTATTNDGVDVTSEISQEMLKRAFTKSGKGFGDLAFNKRTNKWVRIADCTQSIVFRRTPLPKKTSDVVSPTPINEVTETEVGVATGI